MSEAVHVLIVEDEAVIARRIARLTAEILGPGGASLHIAGSATEARQAILTREPDLVLLDLNLGNADGFDLLREITPQPFDTIVISADRSRALEAFSLGVRDYLPKPFSKERLEEALHRVLSPRKRSAHSVEHLGVRRHGEVEFIPLSSVLYIQGAGTRSEVVTTTGARFVHDKMLDRLEALLPDRFERIHKSYLLDVQRIRRLVAQEGSRYSVELEDGTVLPVGRTRVSALRARLA